MSLESILSYNAVPIEGLSPLLINSAILFLLTSAASAVALYLLSLRAPGQIDPAFLPQVEAVRTDLDDPPQGPRELPRDVTCPICMAVPTLPLETNCGHVFCMNCFALYWTHVGDFQPANCPMCRSRVTLLMLSQRREEYLRDADNLAKVESYNRRHSGQPRSFIEQLYDTPAFLRHLFHAFFTPGVLHLTYSIRIVMVLIALLVYVVSPLDIIPESVFGVFGMIDDVIIVIFLLCLVGNLYRAFLVERAYRN